MAAVLVFIILITEILNWMTADDGSWTPDYPRTDLESIVGKPALTEGDYHTILMQTGLGRSAADELLGENTDAAARIRVFEQYQEDFFTPARYDCRVSALIVHGESLRGKDGMLRKGFEIPDVRNGDIFITKATYSLGWRHGHAAIVVDAAKGKTLEAILLGTPSALQNVDKWRTYPSFIHLRLKDAGNADVDEIADYAKENLQGIPYGLLTGIPFKEPDDIKKTQCAHVVWYPYERYGYDLDSDGFWLVTPKDIANSDLLEVVQVYGADPEAIWPGNWPF